jgi:geranylgeranyl pyrophosphate synthase
MEMLLAGLYAQQNGGTASILELPALCSKATSGGSHAGVEVLTSIWALFYAAAHLLDSVEDQEPNDVLIQTYGMDRLVSISTGLIFSAQCLLANLENFEIDSITACSLRVFANRSILRMSSGQHLDLTIRNPTLEQAWQIAELKSGEFFRLACFLGARLGSSDPRILSRLSEFGQQLGIIKQIKDDLKDLWGNGKENSDLINQKWSLPICYALDVLPALDAERLIYTMQKIPEDSNFETLTRDLIVQCGTLVYFGLHIKKCQYLATTALAECCLPFPEVDHLLSILNRLANLKHHAIYIS